MEEKLFSLQFAKVSVHSWMALKQGDRQAEARSHQGKRFSSPHILFRLPALWVGSTHILSPSALNPSIAP